METCGIPNALQSFLNERKQLKLWPAKRKKQLMALWYLDDWTAFHDPATLRRELFNHFLLNRTSDGRQYWRAEEIPRLEAFLAKYL